MPRLREGRVGYSTDRLKGKEERENMKPKWKPNCENNKLIRKLETKDRGLSHFPVIHPHLPPGWRKVPGDTPNSSWLCRLVPFNLEFLLTSP